MDARIRLLLVRTLLSLLAGVAFVSQAPSVRAEDAKNSSILKVSRTQGTPVAMEPGEYYLITIRDDASEGKFIPYPELVDVTLKQNDAGKLIIQFTQEVNSKRTSQEAEIVFSEDKLSFLFQYTSQGKGSASIIVYTGTRDEYRIAGRFYYIISGSQKPLEGRFTLKKVTP